MARPRKYRRPPQGTVGTVDPDKMDRAITRANTAIEANKMLASIGDKEIFQLWDALDKYDKPEIARLLRTLKARYTKNWWLVSGLVQMCRGKNPAKHRP